MQNVSFLAGCDMVVSGFAQIQAQLQYRASGCSIGLPVVVGTSRGTIPGGGGGEGGRTGIIKKNIYIYTFIHLFMHIDIKGSNGLDSESWRKIEAPNT